MLENLNFLKEIEQFSSSVVKFSFIKIKVEKTNRWIRILLFKIIHFKFKPTANVRTCNDTQLKKIIDVDKNSFIIYMCIVRFVCRSLLRV